MIDGIGQEGLRRILEHVTGLLRAHPDDTEALTARALAHSELGDHRRAAEDNGRIIALEPGNVDAYFARASAYAELGEHGPAVEDYSAAIRLEPGRAMAHCSRGACKAALGDLAGAVGDTTRCRQADGAVLQVDEVQVRRNVLALRDGGARQPIIDVGWSPSAWQTGSNIKVKRSVVHRDSLVECTDDYNPYSVIGTTTRISGSTLRQTALGRVARLKRKKTTYMSSQGEGVDCALPLSL
ncbi:MAG: hypothetical protein OXE02_09095 [Chloroflexi bacterium]|nr:hypothetical protein [Chloroflexota bacterium]